MADVTLVIDGKTVTVPAGTNIVDAARAGNVDIPVFCYHPKMNPVGMCRMCLVEVWTPMIDRATNQPVLNEDGTPKMGLMMNKLQPGCTTPVSPGMEVRTKTDKVQGTQRGVLEFLLTSHPLDCPVCDKGGECPLQNLTMGWGPATSRFDYEDKVHNVKPIQLGDLIYLDRERCILCSRCVRFEDEIAGDPVLGFDNRGRKWEIISMSEPGFDSKFSGNTTDICPVGALTSADFRFKARVWELRSTPSIDPHGCEGANITIDMRHDDVKRIMPRENDYVNEIWIADKTRFAHRFAGSQERITTPMIRRNGKLEPCSWEEAIRIVSEKFVAIKNAKGGDALAGLAGDHLANEDLYVFQKLMREVLGSNNIDQRVGSPADLPLNTSGYRLGVGQGTNLITLGKETSVLVIGADPEEEAPVYLLRLRGIQRRGGKLIVANGRSTKLDDAASTRLRYSYGDEVTLVQALSAVLVQENLANEAANQRFKNIANVRQSLGSFNIAQAAEKLGIAEDNLRESARSLASAQNTIVMYGHEAQQVGAALESALENLVVLAGAYGRANSGLLPILAHNNTRGAIDMGIRPDAGPGYRSLPTAGSSASEMWTAAQLGRIRGMYIAGLDPVAKFPASRAGIEALEFLVVQELFLTETAKLADVVLPAAAFLEREGTFTNAERRVQRFRQARLPLGESREDWRIIKDVALAVLEQTTITLPAASKNAQQQGRKNAPAATAVAVAEEPSAAWNYFTVSDIAAEVAERVPGYAAASYSKLSATGSNGSWGRQVNESVYYDGTSYENTEGVGVQLAALVEEAKSTIAVEAPKASSQNSGDSLTLIGAVANYNGGTLMQDSLLLKRLMAPTLFVSGADAKRLNLQKGDQVEVASATSSVVLSVSIDPSLKPGAVVAYSNLAAVPMGNLLTSSRTPVRVTKVEA